MDNAHRLYALADQLPPEDAEWIKTGLGRWLDGEKLSQALAMDRDSYFLAERNKHLKAAYQCVPGDSPYPRCQALAAELIKFTIRVWPRVQIHQAPPERLTDVQRHLFYACAVGTDMPTSARHLYRIVMA